jgi:hypothetical protein
MTDPKATLADVYFDHTFTDFFRSASGNCPFLFVMLHAFGHDKKKVLIHPALM